MEIKTATDKKKQQRAHKKRRGKSLPDKKRKAASHLGVKRVDSLDAVSKKREKSISTKSKQENSKLKEMVAIGQVMLQWNVQSLYSVKEDVVNLIDDLKPSIMPL